jgi:hypothetical protein
VNQCFSILYENKLFIRNPKIALRYFQHRHSTKSDGPSEVIKSILQDDFQSEMKRELPRLRHKVRWHVSGIPRRINEQMRHIVGPNVDLQQIPKKNLEKLIELQSVFITPSDWVKPIYINEYSIPPNQVKAWPVGISDTKHSGDKKIKLVVVYEKNRFLDPLTTSETEALEKDLTRMGYEIRYFQYGDYLQSDFMSVLNIAEFAIWIGETESQGIALAQAWMSGTPTLCRRIDQFVQNGVSYPASSAPYLKKEFGSFFVGRIPSHEIIKDFIQTISNGDCRRQAVKEFSLVSTAKQFAKIIRNVTS